MKSVLCLVLLAAQGAPERPVSPEPWYERLLESINPDNVDYGAIWEERKQAILDASVRNRYFRYGTWSTGLNVFLLLVLLAQRRSHRRSMDVLVQSLADMQAYNDYAREAARKAIRQHNDHIEKCNRVIEASESGELEAAKAEITHLTGENRKLRREQENASAMPPGTPAGPPKRTEKGAGPSQSDASGKRNDHADKQERHLHEQRKKKPHVKGPAFDARHD
jgi:hypothetical protein